MTQNHHVQKKKKKKNRKDHKTQNVAGSVRGNRQNLLLAKVSHALNLSRLEEMTTFVPGFLLVISEERNKVMLKAKHGETQTLPEKKKKKTIRR